MNNNMSYEDFRKYVEPNYDVDGNWIGPEYPPVYHQHRRGALVKQAATTSRRQEPPAWWANADELMNGTKYYAVPEKLPSLKQANMRDKKAWAKNYLDLIYGPTD